MRAILIGGGPVSCLVARQLRKLSIEVDIYERGPDPRLPRTGRGHSFNLTLTLRGLSTLDPELRDVLYGHGVPCPRRVVHHDDGSLTSQPYGTKEHHLLSIPRHVLHCTLLTEAEEAGARVFFDHEAIKVDTRNARAVFVAKDKGVREAEGDLLLGVDGANSIVRHEMTKAGARLEVQQEFIKHGYIELHMPPGGKGEHALRTMTSGDDRHALHLWPRGEFVLIAQPNQDGSYTTTLFMPLDPDENGRPGLRQLTTSAAVKAFFYKYFPDAVSLLPDLTDDFFAAPPASLKIVRCNPFHYGRTVLLGDAAHTMVPFYGQGINCSFEDVATFIELFQRALTRHDPAAAVQQTLADFTAARKAPGDAIIALSRAHLDELSAQAGQQQYHTQRRIERELHERYPDHFVPLYQRVAFTTIPYDVSLELYERDQQALTDLLERFDPETEAGKIHQAFGERIGGKGRSVAGHTDPGTTAGAGGVTTATAATRGGKK
ncbi:FAD-dependent oxidoreductase [Streptomyces sp. NBC_01244]|uniref:FAD-dependent oxidoreductase n=1 Tax=Streptomyces sp. NBC_01244 TaxID=2903797 RepID=UPI002E0DC661|nr:FAD-dependent monooxygenase [Streptomyces sp. NBC_01244]